MKKTFLNFGLFLALGLTTAVFNSCDKDDDNDGGTNGVNASKISATNVINGSTKIITVKALADWKSGDNVYRSDAITQAPYQNNGFTLELPATVGDKYLVTTNDADYLKEISVSDKNSKFYFLYDLSGYNVDDDEIGYFSLEAENDDIYHNTSWVYVDRDVTLKGESKEIDEEYDEESIEKYDLTLKKGWNIVYESDTESFKNGINVDSYTISSNKPSGVNYTWNFHADLSASVALKLAKNSKSFSSKLKGNKKKQ